MEPDIVSVVYDALRETRNVKLVFRLRKSAIFFAALILVSGCSSKAATEVVPVKQIDLQCLAARTPMPLPIPSLPSSGISQKNTPVLVDSVARIVTIAPGSAEIVWSLGLGDSIVGKDLASIFPNSDSIVTVNPGHELALETVLSLEPTIVIADTSDENSVKLEKLVELGFPVVVIPEATSLSEINPRVMAVATALGVVASGDTLTKQIDAELQNSILNKTKEIRIAFLYLRGNAGVYLLGGKGSGADSMIAALGASDVGTQLGISGFAPLTAESLAKANPDVILVMNKGLESVGGIEKLITLPGISSTTAAQNRSIIQADDRALLSFGPQTPNVISCLANQLNQISTLS